LHFAGVKGFLDNLEEMYSRSEEEEGWENFLSTWHEIYGEQPLRVSELQAALETNESFYASLPDGFDINQRSFTRNFGFALKKRAGVYYPSGVHLERGEKKYNVATWIVRKETSFANGKTKCLEEVEDFEDFCLSSRVKQSMKNNNISNNIGGKTVERVGQKTSKTSKTSSTEKKYT